MTLSLNAALAIVEEVRQACDRQGITSLRLASTGACDAIRRRLLEQAAGGP